MKEPAAAEWNSASFHSFYKAREKNEWCRCVILRRNWKQPDLVFEFILQPAFNLIFSSINSTNCWRRDLILFSCRLEEEWIKSKSCFQATFQFRFQIGWFDCCWFEWNWFIAPPKPRSQFHQIQSTNQS